MGQLIRSAYPSTVNVNDSSINYVVNYQGKIDQGKIGKVRSYNVV